MGLFPVKMEHKHLSNCLIIGDKYFVVSVSLCFLYFIEQATNRYIEKTMNR